MLACGAVAGCGAGAVPSLPCRPPEGGELTSSGCASSSDELASALPLLAAEYSSGLPWR